MKLLKYVPLFVLLVIIVSLMPSAYAACTHNCTINNTRSNSLRVVPPSTLAAGQSVGGTLSISWMGKGTPANPTPTVEPFTFLPLAPYARAAAPEVKTVTTAAPPDSATVTMTGQAVDNGKTSPYSCSQNVVLKPDVPVTATCASGPKGATFTVEITNIGEQVPAS
jgi:hypothetical protein